MGLSSDTFTRLCLARDLLAEQGEHAQPIAAIARAARISPFHFIRQFEAVFGSTPHQFRVQLRIDRAKQLLARGELSVTETCLEVGMCSLGSFSDLFLRRVGETPSGYRRRARTLIQVPGLWQPSLFPGCLSLMACLPAHAFRNFGEALDRESSVEFELGGTENASTTYQPYGE